MASDKIQCDKCRQGAKFVTVTVGKGYGRQQITVRDGVVYALIRCPQCGEREQIVADSRISDDQSSR